MNGDLRLRDAYQVARLYYDKHHTMESIASRMGVSRSTVSRLLKIARDEGVVEISLRPPGASRLVETQEELARLYGVQVTVVPTRRAGTEQERLRLVAQAGARVLNDMMEPDITVAFSWGTTLAALASELEPRALPGIKLVQLNGAIDSRGMGLTYANEVLGAVERAWATHARHLAIPTFFDHPEAKEAVSRESFVRSVVEARNRATLAVFGVGSFETAIPSHAYTTSYLTAEDRRHLLEDGAVGDVCTVFMRADGSQDGIRMNRRASGPTIAELQRVPRRLMMAAGPQKAAAVRAALRGGAATDVVLDDAVAAAIIG